jgi:uncharacterized protein YlxW (UPF0749 family)
MVNIKAILGITSVGLMLVTMYEQNNKINDLKSQVVELKEQNGVDSLQAELFIKQTEVGRYELSLDYLKEINPKAAKQFEDYMTHETE